MQLYEFHTAIYACHCVLSDHPPVLWWLSHGRRGMLLHDVAGINCKTGATTENQCSGVKYGLSGVSQ